MRHRAAHHLAHPPVLAVALGLLATPLLAGSSPTTNTPPPVEDTAPTAPALDGVWIWVDPATGELVSTRPEGVEPPAALFAAPLLHREAEELEPFGLRRGGRGVHLGNRMMTSMRVSVGEDGSLTWVCTADHDHQAEHDRAPAPVVVEPSEVPES